MLSEIQESKKDLKELQEKLLSAEAQLNDVKNVYNEQKTSYEMQLNEAEKKKESLKTVATVTSTSTVIFAVLMVVFIFL